MNTRQRSISVSISIYKSIYRANPYPLAFSQASSAHDGTVRLWDVRQLADMRDANANKKARGGSGSAAAEEDSDGSESGGELQQEGGEEEEEEVEAPPPKKLKKAGKAKGPIRLGSDFFADL